MAKQQKLRDKDFLAELAGFAEQQRLLVEAECEGFATDYNARVATTPQEMERMNIQRKRCSTRSPSASAKEKSPG